MAKTIYTNLSGGGISIPTLTRVPRQPRGIRDAELWKFVCRHLIKRHHLAAVDLSFVAMLVNEIDRYRRRVPADKEHWKSIKRLGRMFMINNMESFLNSQHQPAKISEATSKRRQKSTQERRKPGLRISRRRKVENSQNVSCVKLYK